MKKVYMSPACEDVKMDALMVDFLGVASVSGGEAATVTGGQGA